MRYKGHTIYTEGERSDKKAVESLVLIWFTAPGLNAQRLPYIGRAQAFYRVIPSWAVGTSAVKEQQSTDVVHAKWCLHIEV